MPGNVRVGNSLLCDYATPGLNGKNILVNVYSGDIIVNTIPNMSNFGLYAELYFDKLKFYKGTLFIRYDNNIVLHIPLNVNIQNINDPVVIALQQITINITGEGEISATVQFEDSELSVLRKKVRVGTLPHNIGASRPVN